MKLLLLALDALCVVSVSALGLAHRDIHFGASEVDTAPWCTITSTSGTETATDVHYSCEMEA